MQAGARSVRVVVVYDYTLEKTRRQARRHGVPLLCGTNFPASSLLGLTEPFHAHAPAEPLHPTQDGSLCPVAPKLKANRLT